MQQYPVVCALDADAFARIAPVLAVALPRADVRRVEPSLLRRLPHAALAVVGSREDARIARATGFTGGIVCCTDAATDGDAPARSQGISVVGAVPGVADLAAAVAAVGPPSPSGEAPAIDADLARTRQLLAAGEIALTLRHSVNNPLAALLAEIQLLQMSGPADETGAALARMEELVRTMIAITAELDGVRDRRTAP